MSFFVTIKVKYLDMYPMSNICDFCQLKLIPHNDNGLTKWSNCSKVLYFVTQGILNYRTSSTTKIDITANRRYMFEDNGHIDSNGTIPAFGNLLHTVGSRGSGLMSVGSNLKCS